MNRSILIVICDFLLVSLLAFSTVDLKTPAQSGVPQMKPADPATNITGRQDLGDVMRLALDEERKNRDQLAAELTRARALVSQQDQQMQSVRSQLESKAQLAAQLAAEQSNLQSQVVAARTDLTNLNQQLRTTSAESVISKEQTAAMEAEARKQAEKAAALERQLAELQKHNQSLQADQQALQNQLQLSQASNRSALAQMSQLQDEVAVQRKENLRLADGVKVLAAQSSALAREIQDNRELAPNLIFEDISSNRLAASFSGVKAGLFGAESKDRRAKVILVTDGTNHFAIGHVQDTPLMLWSPGTQWQELNGTLARGSASFPIHSLYFSGTDPRVILMPVTAAETAALGCKAYSFAKDPYVFQDAVVVGTREDYYGECKFQIDTSTRNYLKMDHNSLKGLFGKFNPSSGDLVLSKHGELLGVMANDNYCAIIRNFDPEAVLRCGPDSRGQATAVTLSMLYGLVTDLPFKLQ